MPACYPTSSYLQLAYLQSLGVAADALPGLVCSRPLVLGEGIETVVRFLKRAGLPRTQVVYGG